MACEASCIQAANAILGEGAVWDDREGVLYWVDIKRPAVYRWHPDHGQTGHWPMPCEVGAVALREGGGLLAMLRTGCHTLDLASGALGLVADPEEERPDTRFNDACADRQGRVLTATMVDPEREPEGTLYRLEAVRSRSSPA